MACCGQTDPVTVAPDALRPSAVWSVHLSSGVVMTFALEAAARGVVAAYANTPANPVLYRPDGTPDIAPVVPAATGQKVAGVPESVPANPAPAAPSTPTRKKR